MSGCPIDHGGAAHHGAQLDFSADMSYGDYRAPLPAGTESRRVDPAPGGILRFGFTPLYTRFEDVWSAVTHLQQVLEQREWERPEFNQRHAVT